MGGAETGAIMEAIELCSLMGPRMFLQLYQSNVRMDQELLTFR